MNTEYSLAPGFKSANIDTTPAAEPRVGYVNARGTIYKVKGAEPLLVKTPAEQRRESFRQHGFMALLAGAAKRRHVERLEADRQKALATIREARQASGQVIAQVGDTAVEMTVAQATALERHLEEAGQKLRRLMPEQEKKDIFNEPSNTQPS